ncbi:negative regulator of systemic acquired resistance SNI1 isoform X2 [Ananas comosus]|uniref:Negative regulator of systemic acquired resistance SNI1 isoform X2 n=1 Tax=Ananas comosus TaxID=4615 RepID=A0A6P5F6H4_ANACO|nr:negative regulator of systemic acquired resistance SNI1 isoform X2 [Ananas comosus]
MDDPRRRNGGFEENTMAILDSSGIGGSQDIHDDRISFLEAVRYASLVSESPSVPSWNMYDATFQILRDSRSLELAVASYQLLIELDKRYPRVYCTNSGGIGELVFVKEAWSPFILGQEKSHGTGEGGSKSTDRLIDSLPVEDMLLFQYLVSVLEADFIHRHTLYKESLNWVLFRESMLNTLLGSRKLNFKSLVRDFMSLLLNQCQHHVRNSLPDTVGSCAISSHDSAFSLAIAFPELERRTCSAVQKLLTLVMEIDVIKKEADLLGVTSRIDGFRIPILEIILDELTYNLNHVSSFLAVFSEPKWKLEIVLQYFSKYCMKSSVRTRRSNDTANDLTLESVMNFFSTPTATKNIAKKVTSEVALLLLAHAFQVCVSQQVDMNFSGYASEKIGGTVSQISSKFISAFHNLREVDEDLEITPFEKEALFTAATILLQEPEN